MEQYEYTYPEDEEKPRRKPNFSILIALLVGLCVGGFGGYALGSRAAGMIDATGISSSPLFILIANAIVVVFALFFVILKGSKRQRTSLYQPDYITKSNMLVWIALGLMIAGFFAFYLLERIPR